MRIFKALRVKSFTFSHFFLIFSSLLQLGGHVLAVEVVAAALALRLQHELLGALTGHLDHLLVLLSKIPTNIHIYLHTYTYIYLHSYIDLHNLYM